MPSTCTVKHIHFWTIPLFERFRVFKTKCPTTFVIRPMKTRRKYVFSYIAVNKQQFPNKESGRNEIGRVLSRKASWTLACRGSARSISVIPDPLCVSVRFYEKTRIFWLPEHRGPGKVAYKHGFFIFQRKSLGWFSKKNAQMREIAFGYVFPSKGSWTLGPF